MSSLVFEGRIELFSSGAHYKRLLRIAPSPMVDETNCGSFEYPNFCGESHKVIPGGAIMCLEADEFN